MSTMDIYQHDMEAGQAGTSRYFIPQRSQIFLEKNVWYHKGETTVRDEASDQHSPKPNL